MNCTADPVAKATTELEAYLERQANSVAPEPIRIRTPQRKANYSDKARFRRDRLKEIAFKELGWESSAKIKKYLKFLKIRLDLRLTSAWVALIFELKPCIDAAKLRIENSISKKEKSVVEMDNCGFKVGDAITWVNAPAYFHTWWQDIKILGFVEGKAKIEMWDGLVDISELEAA